MIQQQAQILAKKNRFSRGSAEHSAAVDRESNGLVASNIRKLIEEADYAEVTALLQHSSSLSIVPFSAALCGMMTKHRSNELDDLLRLMRSKNILPPESTFNAVVRYFAKGARSASIAASSGTSSKASSSSSSSGVYSTKWASGKKASVEAERANFFFADLKTAFVPSSSTYESMWLMIPLVRHKSGKFQLTEAHEALWAEMTSVGVPPSERVCVSYLHSLNIQFAPIATLVAKLRQIETAFRASFGIDTQQTSASVTSFNQELSGSRRAKHKISGPVAKMWIEKVLELEGEEKAFRLASNILFEIAEHGTPARGASSPFHSSTAIATLAREYHPNALNTMLATQPQTGIAAIPTDFCPLEPLIDALASQGKAHAVVHAWNKMSPTSRVAAAPTTLAAVASASPNAFGPQLFHSLPQQTKADPDFLLTLLSINSSSLSSASSDEKSSSNAFLESILKFIGSLPPTLANNLKKQEFFPRAFKIFQEQSSKTVLALEKIQADMAKASASL